MTFTEQRFAGFLLSLDRFQKQLAEFMLGRYLEYGFGSNSGGEDETTVVPQVLLDVVDGTPQVTLHHGITWMVLARDPEPNEYRLAVVLAFTEAGITVEAYVRLALERDTGEWPAGVPTPYRRHGEGLDIDEALAFAVARVEERCWRHEDAARGGLAAR
ncbi:hypothetical protein [Streptomyces pseudovenezuelae]|uniref:Uncharacterized protein n=1 Tax=Streptomyces pseudovenezuelae TaxID=67350 RepID=A0ABT6LHW8_9ACTN|nr:hypothetical protein [Streptomyces pseudovenezuelae]MDH6215889.1 hypothetical protein [Streptomyces pseudovenezuelae]